MKYAFMTWSTPHLSLDETLSLANRLGYDGIESRIDGKQRHGIEVNTDVSSRQWIRRKAAEWGIALCCIATSCQYADPEAVEQQVEHTHRCIDLAGDLGSPLVRVFGGNLPPGVTREQAIDLLTGALSSLASHAGDRGVTLCVETHDSWANPEHLAQVMERVNDPAIAVNWDFVHPLWQFRIRVEESFQALKKWIRHVHVHDYRFDEQNKAYLTPIGQGEVEHSAAARLLQSISYNGYLSGEWIGRDEPYEEYLLEELETLKTMVGARSAEHQP